MLGSAERPSSLCETGLRVLPDTALDSHGAYSGSAMQFDDKLFLFTGNVRDENLSTSSYRIGALLDAIRQAGKN